MDSLCGFWRSALTNHGRPARRFHLTMALQTKPRDSTLPKRLSRQLWPVHLPPSEHRHFTLYLEGRTAIKPLCCALGHKYYDDHNPRNATTGDCGHDALTNTTSRHALSYPKDKRNLGKYCENGASLTTTPKEQTQHHGMFRMMPLWRTRPRNKRDAMHL